MRRTRDIFIRDVRRSGCRFPERDCILEHQRRSTLYDLAALFGARRSTVDKWNGKNAKGIGTRPSALHSAFHFRMMSCRFFRFGCCQLRKLRKSRRIAASLMLSNPKIKLNLRKSGRTASLSCFHIDR